MLIGCVGCVALPLSLSLSVTLSLRVCVCCVSGERSGVLMCVSVGEVRG